MFSRPILFVGVLIAAVAVPYVLFDDNLAKTASAQWTRLWGKSSQDKADPPADWTRLTSGGPGATLPPTLGATIEEIFRFDVRPQWVTSRWSRVSTVLGDAKQLGMRVAVVSGTRPDDVAGSLTYYFDEHHELQRITFTGMTGDSRRLLAAVVTPNGLKSQPTTDAAYYVSGDPKKPSSSHVTVRHLPIVRADDQRSRQEVTVDLKRSDVVAWGEKAAQQPESSQLPTSYRKW